MDENNRNLMLAIILSALVLFGWQYFVTGPQMKAEQERQARIAHQEKTLPNMTAPGVPGSGGAGAHLTRDQALKEFGPRIAIQTPTLDGTLLLKGARFDDLRLRKYHQTTDPKSPEIVLLAPKSTDFPYYADFGWAASGHVVVPDDKTPWKRVSGDVLAPGKAVTLAWDNGQGLTFTREIAVDDQYMFTVKDSVRNNSGARLSLYPYARVAREGIPKTQRYWVLHEGFVGVANGSLWDAGYDDFKDEGAPPKTSTSTGGWAGITDKYWMAAVIPPQSEAFAGEYKASSLSSDTKAYQADYRLGVRVLAPNGETSVSHRLFAGAKVVDILRHYEHTEGVARFDMAVDWGWFIFFTQPLFWVIDQFYHFLGNFGLAILLATVAIRLALFPLANAQFKSMSRMKAVQPEMQKIQQRFADDKVRQQQEIMELYKREKVNPLTGCLPLLIQMPILFSLYKVLIVTIEMYHAPFYGWIADLSAPDPTSILNLFGLIPFSIPSFVPAFLSIGIWPILMGITQWVQTKMNPPAADPVQQRMLTFMPVFMTAMFATFPAGLIIYYTWNNLLSVTQQYIIMRSQGVPVHLFENLRVPQSVSRLLGGPKTEPGE
jgi:YidC/Oxa1 family membrane protein insertase